METINLATEDITLELGILGNDTLVELDIMEATLVAPGEFFDFLFTETIDMQADGNYFVSAQLNWELDQNTENDSLAIIHSEAVPFVYLTDTFDFNGYTGDNLAFLYEGWSSNFLGEEIPFEATDFLNDWNSNFGTAARFNYHGANKKGVIAGPRFWATATAALQFDLALSQYGTMEPGQLDSDDRLDVLISSFCGEVIDTVLSFTSENSIEANAQEISVSLAPYDEQAIRFIMLASTGEIDNEEDIDLFIDNIAHTGLPLPPPNAGVVNVWQPGAEECERVDHPLGITMRNFSAAPLDSVWVFVELSGLINEVRSIKVEPVILGGQYFTAQFDPINTSGGGELLIKAWTSTDNDSNAQNDTLYQLTTVYPYLDPNLGIDRMLCEGDVLSTSIEEDEVVFLWSNDETGSGIIIESAGEYILTVDNNSCVSTDTINIEMKALPVANLDWIKSGENEITLWSLSVNESTERWLVNDSVYSSDSIFILSHLQGGIFDCMLVSENNCGSDTSSVLFAFDLLAVNEQSSRSGSWIITEADVQWSERLGREALFRNFDLNGRLLFEQKIAKGQQVQIDRSKLFSGLICITIEEKNYCFHLLN